MFGIFEDIVNTAASIIEDAADISLAVVTLGEYGELNKENVSRLLVSGLSIYEISEVYGIAVDLIEKAIED